MHKTFLISAVILLSSCNSKNNVSAQTTQEKTSENTQENPTKSDKDTIRIKAVGDIMLGSNYPSKNGLPNANILTDVKDILQDADITIGNLEGALFDEGGTPKTCQNPSICYVVRMPKDYGKYLVDAGFDLMSIANNHSGDFGAVGRTETQNNLKELGITYAGVAGQCDYNILEKDGIKYGFIGAGHNNGLVSVSDIDAIQKLVKEVKQKADIVIVMFHGGAEGSKYQHVPKTTEMFYGENRGNVHNFAHSCIDAGADIILGSGPHVTRAVELYKNKFIIYSMGNFATFGNFNLKGVNGIAPILDLKINKNGDFISGKIIPTYQVEDTGLGPKIDPEKKVINTLRDLTQTDFPEGVLKITDDGMIIKE